MIIKLGVSMRKIKGKCFLNFLLLIIPNMAASNVLSWGVTLAPFNEGF
jgi:hypothetical protein